MFHHPRFLEREKKSDEYLVKFSKDDLRTLTAHICTMILMSKTIFWHNNHFV